MILYNDKLLDRTMVFAELSLNAKLSSDKNTEKDAENTVKIGISATEWNDIFTGVVNNWSIEASEVDSSFEMSGGIFVRGFSASMNERGEQKISQISIDDSVLQCSRLMQLAQFVTEGSFPSA